MLNKFKHIQFWHFTNYSTDIYLISYFFQATFPNFFPLFLCRQYETIVPLEDSVVTEVTATLQEWAVLWKQLYVVRAVLFSLYFISQTSLEIRYLRFNPLGKNNNLGKKY